MDDSNSPQEHIIEGEIQEESSDQAPASSPSGEQGQAIVLMNLESLIKSHVASIAKLQNEAREQKETLETILMNDETYRDHDEKAKAAAKVKAETRSQITKRPDVRHVAEKLKSLKSEGSELQEELNEYLREYQRMSGNTEIEGDDGEMLKIVTTARLVRSSSGK